MPVVGTAGHVDHGKSLLIEVLTGTNPDRLPEEKLRGMTTDLGFAFFPDREGRPVGVIDVPGHERFIRNMAAGAWSLDCALLVVAADDGWMAQSETHARVLRALAVPAVIPVISKADLAAPARLAEVSADVRSRCAAVFGRDEEPVAVSALKNSGIEELKTRILHTLDSLPPRREEGFPYLYVDRVFSLKGTGLVVAGTLRGAELVAGRDLRVLPGTETVRVRGLHAYNEPVPRAGSGTRTAINLPQPKRPPVRGDCLTVPGAPVRVAGEFLAVLLDRRDIRNHAEVEIAYASAHRIGKIHLIGGGPGVRVVLDAPGAFLPGMRFLVLRHGGSEIIGHGAALWFEAADAAARRRFAAFASGLEPSLTLLEVAMRGYAPEPAGSAAWSVNPAVSGSIVRIGSYLFDGKLLEKLEKTALSAAEKSGGASYAELKSALPVSGDALKSLLTHFTAAGGLRESGGLYSPAEKSDALPPKARALLDAVRRTGKNGWEPDKAPGPAPREEIRFLCRTGLIVSLGGEIFYSAETYRGLLAALLRGKNPGVRFSIPEAKENLGLSRKYMIPLLNRLEQDGWVKRAGDERVVVKTV